MSPACIAAIPDCVFEVGVSLDETLQFLVISSQGEMREVFAVSLGFSASEVQHTMEKQRSEILPSILETAHTPDHSSSEAHQESYLCALHVGRRNGRGSCHGRVSQEATWMIDIILALCISNWQLVLSLQYSTVQYLPFRILSMSKIHVMRFDRFRLRFKIQREQAGPTAYCRSCFRLTDALSTLHANSSLDPWN